MLISDFAIKRPVITVVAMVALAVFGLFALMKLQTDEFPEVTPPVVTVGVLYPGASPDGVEREILDPIEEAISSISGVKKVMGTAQDGFASVMVEFQFGKPLAEATQDIRDAISAIRNDLPPEMEEPIIKKFNDTDRPIVSLAISSTTMSPGDACDTRRGTMRADRGRNGVDQWPMSMASCCRFRNARSRPISRCLARPARSGRSMARSNIASASVTI